QRRGPGIGFAASKQLSQTAGKIVAVGPWLGLDVEIADRVAADTADAAHFVDVENDRHVEEHRLAFVNAHDATLAAVDRERVADTSLKLIGDRLTDENVERPAV